MLAEIIRDLVAVNEEISQRQENLNECSAEARWSGEIDYTTDYWQDKFDRMSQLRWERNVILQAIEVIISTRTLINFDERYLINPYPNYSIAPF